MAESDVPISDPLETSEFPLTPPSILEMRRNRLVDIIKQNNLSQLSQFLPSCSPEDIIIPGGVYIADPLYTAASHGSPEALRMLLEVVATAPKVVQRFNPNLSLLSEACAVANIDVVRFLFDIHDHPENQLPIGTMDLNQRNDVGETPILAAAGSLVHLNQHANTTDFQDQITKGQQLLCLLLDRGSSATDVIPPLSNSLSTGESQVQDSVLGLAVSRAEDALIRRLVDSGADVYLLHQHFQHRNSMSSSSSQFKTATGHAHDVTTLHLASGFCNPHAVRLLLDHCKNNITSGFDLIFSHDSDGRLPLHWAASGPGLLECGLPDEQLSSRVAETLQVLLDNDSSGINLVDTMGSTPLHYAAVSHATCGGSQHAELAIRILLERGADPSIPDSAGRTVLHLLGNNSHQGDSIRTSLLRLILSHGPGLISHTDKDGKTALHFFAQNLRQAAGTRFLIEQGANIRARSLRRETPFHTAAGGILNPHVRGPGRDENATCANKIKLQDEMMHILQEAAREDAAVLMSQPNAEGKTPQDLLKETRDRWRHMEQSRIGGGRGRGRARGLPVGA